MAAIRVVDMKHIIYLGYDTKQTNYYVGPMVHVRGKTQKLGKAVTFNSEAEAQEVVDEICDGWFAVVTKVSDRELFEARLKGI